MGSVFLVGIVMALCLLVGVVCMECRIPVAWYSEEDAMACLVIHTYANMQTSDCLFCCFVFQTCALGLHRCDYMVDYKPVPQTSSSGLSLKQIEMNTIASSFFGLTSQLKGFHK